MKVNVKDFAQAIKTRSCYIKKGAAQGLLIQMSFLRYFTTLDSIQGTSYETTCTFASHAILFSQGCPGGGCRWISRNERVHVLFDDPIDIHPVPVSDESECDILSVLFDASTTRALNYMWKMIEDVTYITQEFSLARRNSDMVRKGTFCIFTTVELSRWRGPVSPAGRISICIGVNYSISRGSHNKIHLRRSAELGDDR